MLLSWVQNTTKHEVKTTAVFHLITIMRMHEKYGWLVTLIILFWPFIDVVGALHAQLNMNDVIDLIENIMTLPC